MAGLIVYGIVEGSIIALGAIGLTLLFGILRFLHFAHGDLMSMGAYLALFMLDLFALAGFKGGVFPYLSFGYPLLAAMFAAMLLTAGIAILINRILYRPLRQRRCHSVVLSMSSLGVAFMLLSLINIIWGPQLNLYSTAIQRAIKLPLSIKIKPDQIFIIAAAMILSTLIYFFLEKTKIGKAMRASSDNLDLAEVAGINTDRVITWTWGIGGALTAAAGTLYAIDTQLMPSMGWNLLLPVFAAAILGGIGNPYGAMVSGLIIGIVENVSTMIIPHDYKTAVSFILIIVLLLFKPSGLFGRK